MIKSYEIIPMVANHFGLKPEEITTPCRKKSVYRARHLAIALLIESANLQRRVIKREVFPNHRSHGTITRSYEEHGFLMLEDPDYKKCFRDLSEKLQNVSTVEA